METVIQLARSPLVDDVALPSVIPPPPIGERVYSFINGIIYAIINIVSSYFLDTFLVPL
jgi:hypothetical protein